MGRRFDILEGDAEDERALLLQDRPTLFSGCLSTSAKPVAKPVAKTPAAAAAAVAGSHPTAWPLPPAAPRAINGGTVLDGGKDDHELTHR